jgi:hypothetical protein
LPALRFDDALRHPQTNIDDGTKVDEDNIVHVRLFSSTFVSEMRLSATGRPRGLAVTNIFGFLIYSHIFGSQAGHSSGDAKSLGNGFS